MDAVLQPGAWTIALLNPIFEFFKSDELAPAIALYLLVIAIVLLIWYSCRAFYIHKSIRGASKVVQEFNRSKSARGSR